MLRPCFYPLLKHNIESVRNGKELRVAAAPLMVLPWYNLLSGGERVKICRLLDKMEDKLGRLNPPIAIASGDLKSVMQDKNNGIRLHQFVKLALMGKCSRQERQGIAEMTGQIAGHTADNDARGQLMAAAEEHLDRDGCLLALENFRLTWEEKSDRRDLKELYDFNRNGVLDPSEIRYMRAHERLHAGNSIPER